MTPTTMGDLVTQQTTDAATVAADNATITADQAKLTTDQGQLTTDLGTQAADQTNFEAELAASGPVSELSADGLSAQILAAPGVTIQPNTFYPLASSVPIPPLTPVIPTPPDLPVPVTSS